MDLSGHEGDLAGMPIPYGSSSGSAGNLHDNKLRLLSSGSTAPASGNGITLPPPHPPPLSVVAVPPAMASSDDVHVGGAAATAAAVAGGGGGKLKKPVRYRECLKNHAASIGGHALDGCGEFMPSGEEGTMEALKCAACDCHRNFHRREVEGEPLICDICHMNRRERNRRAAAIAAGVVTSGQQQPSQQQQQQQQVPISSRGPMNLLALSSRPPSAGGESDAEQLEASLGQQQQHHHHHLAAMTTPLSMKKRFRTKFSIDQKERMYLFAEKVGWRIQKHDEAAVQQFCADAGVKRHVLKVWMHNNKHTFGKRSMVLPPPPSPPPPPPQQHSQQHSSQQHSQQPQQQQQQQQIS